MKVLNPEPSRRLEGTDRLGAELLECARELPASLERMAKLAGGLHSLDPFAIVGDDRRFAFWLNVYNALLLHAKAVWRPRGSLILHLRMFDRAAWRIGEHRFPLNLIEHGLLRANRRIPLSPFRSARSGDPRLGAAPSRLDPRVHFALNCGARSCPPIRVYLSGEIDRQLDAAAAAYFAAEGKADLATRTVTLPRLLKYYAADFGDSSLALAAKHLDAPWALEPPVRVRWASYDWTITPLAK